MLGTHSELCSGQMSHTCICDISALRVNIAQLYMGHFPCQMIYGISGNYYDISQMADFDSFVSYFQMRFYFISSV